jgi:hypothetical protein
MNVKRKSSTKFSTIFYLFTILSFLVTGFIGVYFNNINTDYRSKAYEIGVSCSDTSGIPISCNNGNGWQYCMNGKYDQCLPKCNASNDTRSCSCPTLNTPCVNHCNPLPDGKEPYLYFVWSNICEPNLIQTLKTGHCYENETYSCLLPNGMFGIQYCNGMYTEWSACTETCTYGSSRSCACKTGFNPPCTQKCDWRTADNFYTYSSCLGTPISITPTPTPSKTPTPRILIPPTGGNVVIKKNSYSSRTSCSTICSNLSATVKYSCASVGTNTNADNGLVQSWSLDNKCYSTGGGCSSILSQASKTISCNGGLPQFTNCRCVRSSVLN